MLKYITAELLYFFSPLRYGHKERCFLKAHQLNLKIELLNVNTCGLNK